MPTLCDLNKVCDLSLDENRIFHLNVIAYFIENNCEAPRPLTVQQTMLVETYWYNLGRVFTFAWDSERLTGEDAERFLSALEIDFYSAFHLSKEIPLEKQAETLYNIATVLLSINFPFPHIDRVSHSASKVKSFLDAEQSLEYSAFWIKDLQKVFGFQA